MENIEILHKGDDNVHHKYGLVLEKDENHQKYLTWIHRFFEQTEYSDQQEHKFREDLMKKLDEVTGGIRGFTYNHISSEPTTFRLVVHTKGTEFVPARQ